MSQRLKKLNFYISLLTYNTTRNFSAI